jgi:nitrogen fixation protein FixH
MPIIKQITGKHVLAICVAFFGVMLAVNAVFVYFALSTFGGGEGGKAYQKGLEYNTTIEAARRQDRLGWLHRVEAEASGDVRVVLTAQQGAPVTGLALMGEIGRPVDDRFTRPLQFREVAPGIYSAEAGRLEPGNWVVSLSGARPRSEGEEILYRAKERLWLKPNS